MIEDYKKALKLGVRDGKLDVSAGRYPHPPVLEELVPNVQTLSQVHLGVMQIPLEMVIGTRTTGRQDAFSRSFMPLLGPKTEFATKWSHLYDAQMEEGFRDPIKVYEYLHRFYVEEGNKRTSVLKYLGSPSIEADVTRVMPAADQARQDSTARQGGDDRPDGDNAGQIPDMDQYGEFLQFWRSAPTYEIEFSHPGSYERLAHHLGRHLGEPWPDDVVRNLQSTYLFFKSVYMKAGGSHLDITAGDAFLIYMDIFGSSNLRDTPAAVVRERLLKVWAELAASSSGSETLLVSEPSGSSFGSSPFVNRQQYSTQHPLVAAFAYRGSLSDSFWSRAHDEGRRALEDCYGGVVRTLAYEGCADEETFASAVADAVSKGAEVFFSCSPELMDMTVRAAAEFTGTHFLNCSMNLPHGLVRSYYGRMYEAKFIAGALAASLADDHVVAYRAHLPLYGSVAEINAFAEGVAICDPRARVVLDWARRREDSDMEDLVGKGITTICGSDVTPPFDDPLAYGLYKVRDGRVRNIAVPTWNWGRYYQLIVGSLLAGNLPGVSSAESSEQSPDSHAVTYWYGMSTGVIDLRLSKDLPHGSRKLVELLRRGITSGSISPFMGELVSKDGIVSDEGSTSLTSNQIVSMDWLADNVDGELPDDLEKLYDVSGKTSGEAGE
ncbi:MAG: BMP family ABC transporter substrate-binding protein [Parafannyhessea sp.]|uniref:BMP family ABC transporter substrate-binding protein n=1 Tax=Parafannyhessea sp. TaxID=2847324 RepID=UPI003F039742